MKGRSSKNKVRKSKVLPSDVISLLTDSEDEVIMSVDLTENNNNKVTKKRRKVQASRKSVSEEKSASSKNIDRETHTQTQEHNTSSNDEWTPSTAARRRPKKAPSPDSSSKPKTRPLLFPWTSDDDSSDEYNTPMRRNRQKSQQRKRSVTDTSSSQESGPSTSSVKIKKPFVSIHKNTSDLNQLSKTDNHEHKSNTIPYRANVVIGAVKKSRQPSLVQVTSSHKKASPHNHRSLSLGGKGVSDSASMKSNIFTTNQNHHNGDTQHQQSSTNSMLNANENSSTNKHISVHTTPTKNSSPSSSSTVTICHSSRSSHKTRPRTTTTPVVIKAHSHTTKPVCKKNVSASSSSICASKTVDSSSQQRTDIWTRESFYQDKDTHRFLQMLRSMVEKQAGPLQEAFQLCNGKFAVAIFIQEVSEGVTKAAAPFFMPILERQASRLSLLVGQGDIQKRAFLSLDYTDELKKVQKMSQDQYRSQFHNQLFFAHSPHIIQIAETLELPMLPFLYLASVCLPEFKLEKRILEINTNKLASFIRCLHSNTVVLQHESNLCTPLLECEDERTESSPHTNNEINDESINNHTHTHTHKHHHEDKLAEMVLEKFSASTLKSDESVHSISIPMKTDSMLSQLKFCPFCPKNQQANIAELMKLQKYEALHEHLRAHETSLLATLTEDEIFLMESTELLEEMRLRSVVERIHSEFAAEK